MYKRQEGIQRHQQSRRTDKGEQGEDPGNQPKGEANAGRAGRTEGETVSQYLHCNQREQRCNQLSQLPAESDGIPQKSRGINRKKIGKQGGHCLLYTSRCV